jgi:hypothetical protein
MMILENAIKDTINAKLSDGTVEKLIGEHLEKGISSALNDLFRSYGDINKMIENKLKEAMVPYFEQHSFADSVVKLDAVLTQVIQSSAAAENKKLLENFKSLMMPVDDKELTASKLFEKWSKYVAAHVDTDDLEVIIDDGAYYEPVDVCMQLEVQKGRSYSVYDYGTLFFSCEHDEEMNFAVPVSRWKQSKDSKWDMSFRTTADISSLRRLNDFEIYLMRLSQAGVKIEIDTESETDSITPDKEPEPEYR